MAEHRLSIRDMVPSPDLAASVDRDSAKSHSAAQASLRRKYKSFQSEITLAADFDLDGDQYRIKGRIDGIRRVRGGYCIYEIKPVKGNPKDWLSHIDLLRARWQLLLYADLIRTADSPFRDKLRQAVLMLVGDNGKHHELTIDLAESSDAISRRLRAIGANRKAIDTRSQCLQLLESIIAKDRETDRPIQSDTESQLASDPLPDRILLTLPPGSGKTRIALRFALRQARLLNRQVFWITAKATGRNTVLEEIERLNKLGLPLTFTWKTTADRLCDCEFDLEICPIRRRTQTAIFFGEHQPADENELENYCDYQIQQHRQSQSQIVIADVNYLLNRSSLTRQLGILVIDEVQHFVNRLLEYSRLTIPLRQLKALLRELPTSKRAAFTELFSPEWIDDELSCPNTSLWIELSELIRVHSIENDFADIIHHLAWMLNGFPEESDLIWYSVGGDSGWIGLCRNPESLVAACLENFRIIAALSGSLPANNDDLDHLLPGFADFDRISASSDLKQLVTIVPLLDFRFPISQNDIKNSLEYLLKLHEAHGRAIAVFLQNSESSLIIGEALRVRGYTFVFAMDFKDDWDYLKEANPDFVLIPLGSSLTESVNLPSGLFSCSVVLSPGHKPRDRVLEHLTQKDETELLYLQSVRESVSRIIQAAGRVQRAPDQIVPVYLLNHAFTKQEFLSLWPQHWYHEIDDIIFDSLDCAIDYTLTTLSEFAHLN